MKSRYILVTNFEGGPILVHFQLPQSAPFCVEQVELAPWREWMCNNMAEFISSFVCFDYGLAILLVLVLGGLGGFDAYLISIGETLIDFMVFFFGY